MINEDVSNFMAPNVLFLFELVDFGPTIPSRRLRPGHGLYRIAWAFFRPVGPAPDYTCNLSTSQYEGDVPARLQLYRYTDDRWLSRYVTLRRVLAFLS